MKRWSQINALYQIYPRSFRDSNGDGVGDMRGIIERLDYFKGSDDSLGVDAIWLSPFYPSPMADFGYDVSDYCDVDPLFGTIDDFQELLAKAHDLDIKVMIDFVPNHTSDEHSWFEESRSSLGNPRRDWYVWRDPQPDGSPPNNWLSFFGGSAWEFDEITGQYYLHSFLSKQPDLNWDNPEVRRAMGDVLRFWLDKGIDGFRVDVARVISKDPELRDEPENPNYHDDGRSNPHHRLIHQYSQYGPHLMQYWQEMATIVAEYPEAILLFEDYPGEHLSMEEQYRLFYDINPGLSMPFNFQGLMRDWNPRSLGAMINEFQGIVRDNDRAVYCFSNHDQPRIVSRYNGERARLIAMLLLTLPGMPVMYYGDEIGMTGGVIPSDQVQDPVELREPGRGLGRDPERTPMQWNEHEHAGFSDHTPWLPLSPDVDPVTVQQQDDDSYWQLYHQLLRLRRDEAVLRGNDYEEIICGDAMLAYRRSNNEKAFEIYLNFSADMQTIGVAQGVQAIVETWPSDKPRIDYTGLMTLGPYEGVVLELL